MSDNTDTLAPPAQPEAPMQQPHAPPQGPPQGAPHGAPPQYYGGHPQQQQQMYYQPPPPQGIMVPYPIPSDSMLSFFRSPLRMRLLQNYVTATRYQPTQEEQGLLSTYTAKSWLQTVLDVGVPVIVWIRTAPKMSDEQIAQIAGDDHRKAARLKLVWGRGFGLSTPMRFAAIFGSLVLLKMFSGSQDGMVFDVFAKLQSPLGEYARYLQTEGQRAAQLNLQGVPHPPIPTAPVQPVAQPPAYPPQPQQPYMQQPVSGQHHMQQMHDGGMNTQPASPADEQPAPTPTYDMTSSPTPAGLDMNNPPVPGPKSF